VKARLATLLLACMAVSSAAGALGKRAANPFPDLPTAAIRVLTASGAHSFAVWIAANDPSRERGLMYVRELPPDQGMLFLFDRPQFAGFWMKNTYLSLDLIFIAEDGRVVNIARRAPPHSLDVISSSAPVKGVLELIAGSADRIGLKPGDRVLHPAFTVRTAP